MGICNCFDKRSSEEGTILLNEDFENIACTVKCNNSFLIGFICNIKIPNKKCILSTLITTSQTLGKNENDIELNKNIEIHLNYSKAQYNIKIDNSRKIYVDKENDITIIEIKKEDGIDINNLLEIDLNKSEEDIINCKNSETIYLLNYKYNTKIIKYLCQIKNDKEQKMNFYYLSKDVDPLPGCPLLLFSERDNNTTIIGIHKEVNEKDKDYKGIFIKDIIKKFLEENNFINKEKIQNVYVEKKQKVNYDDEFIMKYKIIEDTKIRIFGDDFVENNKEICKIIIGEKEEELCAFYETENIKLKDDKILEIILKGIKNITDLSSMFLFCNNLISYSYINFDSSKIINMSNIFCGCELLENIPDISKWKTYFQVVLL